MDDAGARCIPDAYVVGDIACEPGATPGPLSAGIDHQTGVSPPTRALPPPAGRD